MLNLRWKVVIIEVGGANNIMEFRDLKYFLMVAREENITKEQRYYILHSQHFPGSLCSLKQN